MHTRTFSYIPTKVGAPMMVTIDQDDEVLNITIGDQYLGSMVEDPDSPHGWQTGDPELAEELPELAMALKEEKATANLPYVGISAKVVTQSAFKLTENFASN